jgi:predicted amidophosphoribosyltransferase
MEKETEREKLGICKNCRKRVADDAATCPNCGQAEPFQGMDEDLLKLKEFGQSVDAMKRVIRVTGWSVDEARAYVDAL